MNLTGLGAIALTLSTFGCQVWPTLTPQQLASLPDTTLCQHQLTLGNYLIPNGDPFQEPATSVQGKLDAVTSEVHRRGIDCSKIVQPIHA